jgi:hypothetical protein
LFVARKARRYATVKPRPEDESMMLICAGLMLLLAGPPAEKPAATVQGENSPVRLDRATVLTTGDGPPVLVYAATNLTDDELDEFTVMAFVLNAEGTLKAKQVAPARRTLEARATKYSTIVLDGSPIEPTDSIVIGVNQAQRVKSDVWWRADLQAAAEAAVRRK